MARPVKAKPAPKVREASLTEPLAAYPVPSSPEEADDYARKIASYLNEAGALEVELRQKVEELTETYSGRIAVPTAEALAYGSALATFARANRSVLTDDKRKSFTLKSGGTLEWRHTPPAIAFTKDAKKILAYLVRRFRMKNFVRIKLEISKEDLLAHPEIVKTIPGVAIETHERFYIKPAGSITQLEYDFDAKKSPRAK